MSGLQFWDDREQDLTDWDVLILGGEVMPGLVTITGDGVSRKLDVKKAKGADQAKLTDEGYRNAKFTISVMIWDNLQWEELQRILPLIHPRRKGGSRSPLQIFHPSVNLLGINSCYVQKIGLLEIDKSTVIGTMTIDCIEWVESGKEVKKAGGVGPPQSPVTEDGDNDDPLGLADLTTDETEDGLIAVVENSEF